MRKILLFNGRVKTFYAYFFKQKFLLTTVKLARGFSRHENESSEHYTQRQRMMWKQYLHADSCKDRNNFEDDP